jgi:hypothetical protein
MLLFNNPVHSFSIQSLPWDSSACDPAPTTIGNPQGPARIAFDLHDQLVKISSLGVKEKKSEGELNGRIGTARFSIIQFFS